MLAFCILAIGLAAVNAGDFEAPPLPVDDREIPVYGEVEFVERSTFDDEEFEERGEEEGPSMSMDEMIINAGQATGYGAYSLSETPIADGSMLAEGDMLLTPEQVAEDALDKRIEEMGLGKRKGIKSTRSRWPNNVLPYVIKQDFSSRDLREINNAIADWNKYTCVSLQQRRNEQNYITIQDGGGCSSYVGVINRGSQPVSLGNGCRWKSVVLHELGHALGFQHEQCRYDRDSYLTIHLQNVQQKMRHNFDKYTAKTMTTNDVPYDYSSIMQYGQTAFGGGKRTITTKDSAYQNKIGNSKGLSFADLKAMNLMYQCGSRCSGSCGDGYMDKNCKCQCASGADNFRSGTVPIKQCGSGTSTGGGNTGGGGGGSCSNASNDCDGWAQQGFCKSGSKYANYMGQSCRKSCRFC